MTRPTRQWLAGALGLLLCALGVAGMDQLGWPEYARLLALLLALAAGWRWAGSSAGMPLASAVLVAGAAHLCPPAHGGLALLLWLSLAVVTACGAVFGGASPPAGLTRLEATGLTVALAVCLLSVGGAVVLDLGTLWPVALQWLLYPLVWLALGRWLGSVAPAQRRWLLAPAAVVFGVASMTGSAIAATAVYELRMARGAESRGDPAAAADGYRRAQELAQRLRLTTVEQGSRLGRVSSLAAQGQLPAARALLGIPADEVVAIEPDQWEGPTGALLFKNVSCWTDLWLWEGSVDVEIWVNGQAARGEWPRLRVELAGQELGEVEVTSTAPASHSLTARVPTGRHRLQVSLVNGFWTSGGEHRWARLGRAQLRYQGQAE